MRAGFGVRDVTPVNGEDLCGFAARTGKTTGIHDRLFSKWIALDDGQARVVIGGNDIIGFSRSLAVAVRRSVAGAAEVPVRNVHLAATHTHSGPAAVHLRRCGKMSPSYVRKLQTTMIEAGCEAVRNLDGDIEIGVAAGSAGAALNRRDPKAGPVDRTVVLVGLRDRRTGKLVSTICNFACHAVVMGEHNCRVSADYPGRVQSLIEQATGAPCMFLNGACGDLNPRLAHSVNFDDVDTIASEVATEALRLQKELQWSATPGFAARSLKVKLPTQVPTSRRELEVRFDRVTSAFHLPADIFADRLETYADKLKNGTFPRSVEAELSAVELSPELGVFFLPGEVFTEIGMQIRKLAPWRHTLIVGYADGCVGYLPTRKAYDNPTYEPYLAPLFYNVPEFTPNVEAAVISGAETLLSSMPSAAAAV